MIDQDLSVFPMVPAGASIDDIFDEEDMKTMSRVYNFSAGPAVLPEEVLKEVAEEMMDYQGTGMSVMEMSHRSADFQKIIDEAEQDLRDLMKIPDNYKVLFLQAELPSSLQQSP